MSTAKQTANKVLKAGYRLNKKVMPIQTGSKILGRIAPGNPITKSVDAVNNLVDKGIDRITKRRGGYVKGGSAQPFYKHGECPKGKAN